MNIYASHDDPLISARNLDDNTLKKAVPEGTQILCSALFNLNAWKSNLYKPTFVQHPCVRWAGRSRKNFNWLVLHCLSLCNENKRRFGRELTAVTVILNCAEYFQNIPMDELSMTPFSNQSGYPHMTVLKGYQACLEDTWKVSHPVWTKGERPTFKKKAA